MNTGSNEASWLTVRVAAKRKVADDIIAFELVSVDKHRLPPFSAGAHIDVEISAGLVRQYSLCNDPAEAEGYSIGVLKSPESRGGSKAMHEVNVDETLRIRGPRNHFPLVEGTGTSYLIAGGVGITPILAMAESLANAGKRFEVHFSARSRSRAAFVERIKSSRYADRSRMYFNDEGEHFSVDEVLKSPDSDAHVYVCGPVGFMQHVLEKAVELGWSDGQLHREYFVPPEIPPTGSDAEFKVQLASSGVVYSVRPDETIVSVLARHGIEIPVSCEQGICGTCLTGVVSGEVDHRDGILSNQERSRNNVCTPCCSRSRSDVLILDI